MGFTVAKESGRRFTRTVTCGVVLAAFAGCGGADDVAVPIRLADRLEQATIHSVLTRVDAAADIAHLADVPGRTVFEEDFSDFDLAAAGWPTERATVTKVDGERALRIAPFDLRDRYVWVVQAEPSTHYLFERRIHTEGPVEADLAVVEVNNPALILQHPARADFMSQGPEVRLHWPTPPAGHGWQQGAVALFTTPETRALVISMRPPQDRHADVVRWGPRAIAAGLPIAFDDVRLVRLAPRPKQQVALMKAAKLAPDADPDLGMRKRGQLAPLGDPDAPPSPAMNNFSHRSALYAPPPTELRFPLHIPEHAVLRFSTCLAAQTMPGASARFEVAVSDGGGEHSLWTDTLTAEHDQWYWHDQAIPLGDHAGDDVELVLRTVGEKGMPHPLWGNPVVDVPPPAGGPRNVILIAVDTLRADALSCYGYQRKTSPRIDELAAGAVRFANVASNANWTCPSFASIFTGVVPSRHGVLAYGPVTPLPQELVTLAERFHAAGWATQSIVYKAPLYNGGFEQGFDVAFNAPRIVTRADDNLAEALDWLERSADRRNFLFLHFDDPHTPFCQPEPFDHRFGPPPSQMGLPWPLSFEGVETDDPTLRRMARALYDGEVAYVDDRIGKFLDALRQRGLYDDAVIAFVADHGEEFWEHGGVGHGGPRLYDELVHVPLIVKPSRFDPDHGHVVQTQVSSFDLMPTLLELAGLPVPEDGIDARSLVPLLSRDVGDVPDRVAVTESRGGLIALRTRQWKYLRRHGYAEEVLFDLRTDPGEHHDVAARHPDVLRRLRLRTLEYQLLRAPGRYLVWIEDAATTPRSLRIEGVRTARRLFGLPATLDSEDDGVFTVRGKKEGPILSVIQVVADGSVVLDGTPAPEFQRYRAGDLERLRKRGEPGVFTFEGPPPVQQDEVDIDTVDLQQLQALRAVGYTGHAPDDGGSGH